MRFTKNNKDNPRSTLTGPKWDAAREKLRGAAAGTRKNPVKGEIQIMREFMELLRDPDPSSMQIAEDLLLESGITLVRAGQWVTGDQMTGKFVLASPDPVSYFTDAIGAEFKLGPVAHFDPKQGETSVAWKIEKQSERSYYNEFEYRYSSPAVAKTRSRTDIKDDIKAGRYYLDLDAAQRTAAADAWVLAKALKSMKYVPGDADDLRDEMMMAYAGERPDLEAPEALNRFKLAKDGKILKVNPTASKEALDKYEEFHRYKPTKIGEFKRGFSIPATMYEAGKAKWTTYRSGKVDPSTLQRPRRPVNYIHEHDAGVGVYLPVSTESRSIMAGGPGRTTLAPTKTVPREFQDVEALVKLGESLGFCFERNGEEIEAEGAAPLPELYCSPDGRCLYVIQDKSEVLAMIWGGGLGVFARGIDG